MYIYKITNEVNGKIYIGKTKRTIEERFHGHIKSYKKWKKNGKKGRTGLYHAFDKYGIENFSIIEIDTAETEEELNEKEIYWIEYYNSRNKNIGYNIARGGNGDWSPAHEWYKNASAEEKEVRNNKISERLKLIDRDDQWCDNIGKSLTGHEVSAETRQKLCESKSGRIACYNKKTNECIFVYESDVIDLNNDWIIHSTGVKFSDDSKDKLRKIRTGTKYSREVNMSKGRSKYIFKIDDISTTDWHIFAEYVKSVYNVEIESRYVVIKLCTSTDGFIYKKYRHLDFLVNKCSFEYNI